MTRVGPPEEPRLQHLTRICLALPQSSREILHDHAAFRVGMRTFAYFLHNHHGDGIVSVTAKVGPGDNEFLRRAQPDRFYLPAYIGSRGWVALRLDRGEIDWEEVTELVRESYRRVAPKKLAAQVLPGI